MKKLSFVIVFSLFINALFAQSKTGSIKGSVQNNKQEPLAGLTVQLLNTNKSTQTNEEGEFTFNNLPEGNYTLVAKGVNFSAQKQNVSVSVGKTVQLTLQLAENNTELKEVVVSSKKSNPLTSANTSTTRLPILLKDLPQQVQVVSAKTIREQGSVTLNDLYKNASGVISTGASAYTAAMIRGFDVDNQNFLYNGQRGGLGGYNTVPFLPQIEEVQFIKGPAGVVLGEGGVGGTINLVTKKPLFTEQYAVSAAAGSFDNYRLTYDATNTLDKQKKLAYRISGGYEDSKSFSKFYYNKTLIVAPSIIFKPTNSTYLEWNGSFMNDKRNVGWQNGVPSVLGNIFALPRNFTANDPDDYAKTSSIQSQINFQQQLAKGLKLNVLYNYSLNGTTGSYWILSTSSPVDSSFKVKRSWEQNIKKATTNIHSVNPFVTYSFGEHKWKHTFVVGYDFNYRKEYYPESQDVPVDGFDVLNPVYNGYLKDTLQDVKYIYGAKSISHAGYLQYLLKFNDKFTLLLGGRHQSYKYYFEYTTPGSPYFDSADNKSFLPKIGISYAVSKQHNFFVGYSQGFSPQTSNNPSQGGPFPAIRSKQYEAGIKSSWFNNLLSTTLSVYQITKSNVLTADLSDTTGNKLTPVGEITSKGVELDITGNITPDLSIIANYAYNKLNITKSNVAGEEGKSFNNWIPNMANLWATYSFNQQLKGLKLGLGANYSDKRLIDVGGSLYAPSYVLLNAMVSYGIKNIQLSLNVNNINNKDYVAGSFFGSTNYIFRGAPTSAVATLRYAFNK